MEIYEYAADGTQLRGWTLDTAIDEGIVTGPTERGTFVRAPRCLMCGRDMAGAFGVACGPCGGELEDMAREEFGS